MLHLRRKVCTKLLRQGEQPMPTTPQTLAQHLVWL